MNRHRGPTVFDFVRGFELYLIAQFIDVNYLLWRSMWDTTEEEDFMNGTCEATIITKGRS